MERTGQRKNFRGKNSEKKPKIHHKARKHAQGWMEKKRERPETNNNQNRMGGDRGGGARKGGSPFTKVGINGTGTPKTRKYSGKKKGLVAQHTGNGGGNGV